MRLNQRALARFEAKIMRCPMSGCWLWTASLRSGYAQFAPHWKRITLGHRVSWEHYCGDIPPGLCVLHRCDTRPCVNPYHLFLGTIKDNNMDKSAKGRAWNRNPAYGERSSNARLTAPEVEQIRIAVANGIGSAALSQQFRVSATHIRRIVTRKAWAHL